jgi:hypothetical protein
MRALLNIIHKADREFRDHAADLQTALRKYSLSQLFKWHDQCEDGRLMDGICDEIARRQSACFEEVRRAA